MKYLGIDFGTKKVGIAISDDAGEFAFPKEIVATADAHAKITKLCAEEKVAALVVGESIASNEEKNVVDESAKRFVEKLKVALAIPIHFEREDFSSVEAHRFQTKAGNRDDSAAAIILQRYLDKQRAKVE